MNDLFTDYLEFWNICVSLKEEFGNNDAVVNWWLTPNKFFEGAAPRDFVNQGDIGMVKQILYKMSNERIR